MIIRKAIKIDTQEWARMRNSLWPDTLAGHTAEIVRYFNEPDSGIVEVYVLERSEGGLGGFIELNLRNYAPGSDANQVPYVEGWYIDEDLRGQGLGKGLIQAAELWAKDLGYHELASDALLDNEISHAAHKALGFEEVERLVCFIKKLE